MVKRKALSFEKAAKRTKLTGQIRSTEEGAEKTNHKNKKRNDRYKKYWRLLEVFLERIVGTQSSFLLGSLKDTWKETEDGRKGLGGKAPSNKGKMGGGLQFRIKGRPH